MSKRRVREVRGLSSEGERTVMESMKRKKKRGRADMGCRARGRRITIFSAALLFSMFAQSSFTAEAQR